MPAPRTLLIGIAVAIAGVLAPTASAAVAPVQLAKLSAAPTVASAALGSAIAISGSTVVVGAPDFSGATSGSAYVYAIGDDGAVTQIARLTASNGQAGDLFGYSVAISGDTIVVAAPGELPQSTFAGSGKRTAYVFLKPASGWRDATETARLTAAALPSDLTFPFRVAISGDTIAAAAHDPLGGTSVGRACVYVKPIGGWATMSQTACLQPAGVVTGKYSGIAVAIDGPTIALGSSWDDAGGTSRGVVHVFERPAGGWVDATGGARLTASDGADFDGLGLSVAVSNDTVVAGAPSGGFGNGPGAAYVFVRPTGGWVAATQTAKLTVPGAAFDDRVGSAVAIDGSRVAVSASASGRVGGAWLYERPTGGWASAAPTAALGTSDATTSDFYGSSIAQAGTTTVVGARAADSGRGSAYVFTTRALPPTALAATSACATTLSFTAGASAGSPITGYERSIDGGAWTPVAPAATASPVAIAGLTRGATASVRLRAVTAEGSGFQSAGLAVAMPKSTACTSISRVRVNAKGVVTARVKVGAAGVVTIAGKRLGRASRVTCRGRATAKRAGTVVITCTPNRATKARLNRGRIRALMTVTMKPTIGATATATKTVVLPRNHAVRRQQDWAPEAVAG